MNQSKVKGIQRILFNLFIFIVALTAAACATTAYSSTAEEEAKEALAELERQAADQAAEESQSTTRRFPRARTRTDQEDQAADQAAEESQSTTRRFPRARTRTEQAIAETTLAILPFTGAQGDEGETIAELFSFEEGLTAVFKSVPRTSITDALNNERGFQLTSGMTDPDTIVAIGKQLGAQYVVAGTITKLGTHNLLVISILNTETLQQITGDIQTYKNIEEIRGKLPGIARNIVAAVKINTANLPALAVLPVDSSEMDNQEANIMAQILAIHLIRSARYAVYPRTQSLEQVQEEYNSQSRAGVANEYLSSRGKGTNPRLALSVTARNLGSITMFNASIINLETGMQQAGGSVDYQSLDDGKDAMKELAEKLTGQEWIDWGKTKQEQRDAETALEKAEADRQAAQAMLAQAEEERRIAEEIAAEAKAEQERQTVKQAAAAAQAEEERLSAQAALAKAEEERKAAQAALAKAEQERKNAETATTAQAEADRKAAEAALAQAEADRKAAQAALAKAEQERRSTEQATAAAQAEQERIAKEQAAVAAQAEADRKAAEAALVKAEQERKNAETALAKADQEQKAAQAAVIAKAEQERKNAEAALAKAEQERLAAERAAAQAEQERAAAQALLTKAEEERKNAQTATTAKAEQERAAAQAALAKAEQERLAAERAVAQAEEERKAAQALLTKAEEEHKNAQTATTAKAEQERKNAEAALAKAEQERKNAEAALAKAEQERLAAERAAAQAEQERKNAQTATTAKAEQERAAAQAALAKAEQERKNAEAALAKAEQERKNAETALAKSEQERLAAERAAASAPPVQTGMALVPAGSFMMGSDGSNDNKPAHRVTISAPFFMSKYEITQKEWTELMGTTIAQQWAAGNSGSPTQGMGDNYPMYCVSWYEAVEYCNKRSIKEGLEPAYTISGTSVTWNRSANGYRLPTEAEWEWAARSGGKDTYTYAGSNSVDAVAWYYINSGSSTHPVGTKAANSLGLYDMSGNVYEWCWDWYSTYESGSVTDPTGAVSGGSRVSRGGSWLNNEGGVRSAYRSFSSPASRHYDLGFRVVCQAASATSAGERAAVQAAITSKEQARPSASATEPKEQARPRVAAGKQFVINERVAFIEAITAINADSAGGTYTITLNGNFYGTPVVFFQPDAPKTIILKGDGTARTITNNGESALFTVPKGVTLVLDEGITLNGNRRRASLVAVKAGIVRMNSGSTIRNAQYSGGVYVSNGTFTMYGGEISGNTSSSGGGVYVAGKGTFTMEGGAISGNTAAASSSGGGVFVNGGTFTMQGGAISGNTAAASSGGGVYVDQNGTFTKRGGTIDATNDAQNGRVAYVYISSSNSHSHRNSAAGPGVNLDSTKSGSAGGWEQ